MSSLKLLGVVLSNTLKWDDNTDYICNKARRKIWLIRNMKLSGLTESELVDAFKKEIRSLLELAVPVWHGTTTKAQSEQIERIQKSATAAILGPKFTSYEDALKSLKLQRLSERRTQICIKFIEKNMKSECPLLSLVNKTQHTRSASQQVQEFFCRTQAFFDSSLPFLAKLCNQKFK